jgi:hypothetical protein
MLGALKDEIPTEMGKAQEGLTAPGTRTHLRLQWRSTVGAREPLSVQGRIPFSE